MTRPNKRRATRAPLSLLSAVALALTLAACGGGESGGARSPRSPGPAAGVHGFDHRTVAAAAPPVAPAAANIYAAITGEVSAALADVPPRVYVPNSAANTVDVIDPATFAVVDHYSVGATPHHITPSWDLTKLLVDNTDGNSLTVIDPRTGKPSGTIPVTDPYNLYFTPDGSKAIVVAERYRRLDFRDPGTWQLIKSVPIPWLGVDHLDFSADGRYLMATTEFSGMVVKVDTVTMEVAGNVQVGGLPIDVKVSPDGLVFYVTNQSRHGVSVIDPVKMEEIAFLPTGKGAHGLAISRDTKSLYVSNRLAGSISLIDLGTRTVSGVTHVGGSPDMLQISPDGRQLWVTNRYNAGVSVLDAQSGELLRVIKTGRGAHGLTYFPQPGRISIGHNGVYR